ncbi:MAG: hypothetical protein KC777_17095, partial [Cyanobacteria bacterium HKST-UBA02]|nr:hypothetical protein [Cyanobacteria bacterium HKST-UBA02]
YQPVTSDSSAPETAPPIRQSSPSTQVASDDAYVTRSAPQDTLRIPTEAAPPQTAPPAVSPYQPQTSAGYGNDAAGGYTPPETASQYQPAAQTPAPASGGSTSPDMDSLDKLLRPAIKVPETTDGTGGGTL